MTARFRQYAVAPDALRQAEELGIVSEGARDQLSEMARRAAMLTHETGNRRFDCWWLRVEQGEVVAVGRLFQTVPVAPTVQKSEAEKLEAKRRVEAAIALHFPKRK